MVEATLDALIEQRNGTIQIARKSAGGRRCAIDQALGLGDLETGQGSLFRAEEELRIATALPSLRQGAAEQQPKEGILRHPAYQIAGDGRGDEGAASLRTEHEIELGEIAKDWNMPAMDADRPLQEASRFDHSIHESLVIAPDAMQASFLVQRESQAGETAHRIGILREGRTPQNLAIPVVAAAQARADDEAGRGDLPGRGR